MVDEARVLRLLRSIANDTAVLRQEAGASEERRQDPIWLRGVKYTFVTAMLPGWQHQPFCRYPMRHCESWTLSATSRILATRFR